MAYLPAEFARNFVNEIAIPLEEYGKNKGYGHTTQFYQDLAWGGLTDQAKRDSQGNIVTDSSGNIVYEETPLFQQLAPTPADRLRIKNTILTEMTGKDINGNTQSQTGNSGGC